MKGHFCSLVGLRTVYYRLEICPNKRRKSTLRQNCVVPASEMELVVVGDELICGSLAWGGGEGRLGGGEVLGRSV